MKKNNLENFLIQISKELYPFLFAILPDDWHISRIIDDAFTVTTVNDRELLCRIQGSENIQDLLLELELKIYKYCYNMAKTSYSQLSKDGRWSESRIFQESEYPFFQLDVEERALLYIWTHKKTKIEMIIQLFNEKADRISDRIMEVRSRLLMNCTKNNQGQELWR